MNRSTITKKGTEEVFSTMVFDGWNVDEVAEFLGKGAMINGMDESPDHRSITVETKTGIVEVRYGDYLLENENKEIEAFRQSDLFRDYETKESGPGDAKGGDLGGGIGEVGDIGDMGGLGSGGR